MTAAAVGTLSRRLEVESDIDFKPPEIGVLRTAVDRIVLILVVFHHEIGNHEAEVFGGTIRDQDSRMDG
jgi:hypothetical protein